MAECGPVSCFSLTPFTLSIYQQLCLFVCLFLLTSGLSSKIKSSNASSFRHTYDINWKWYHGEKKSA